MCQEQKVESEIMIKNSCRRIEIYKCMRELGVEIEVLIEYMSFV